MLTFSTLNQVLAAILQHSCRYEMPWQHLEASVSVLIVLALVLYLSVRVALKPRSSSVHRPPTINVSMHDLIYKPRETFERAVKEHGPVIGVHMLGRLRYLVSEEHFKNVLTDDKTFSFEKGNARFLNLQWLSSFDDSFIHDMHQVVEEGLRSGLDDIVDTIAPAYLASAEQSVREAKLNSQNRGSAVADIVASSHRATSEAMLMILFGKDAISDPRAVAACQQVVYGMVSATGIDATSKPWHINHPWVYRIWAWMRLVICLFTTYFPVFLPIVWRMVQNHNQGLTDFESRKGSNMATIILKRYVNPSSGKVPLRSIVPMACAVMSLIFGGVHQVGVAIAWVTYELANRPEYIPILREEMYDICGTDVVPTYAVLRKAEKLDSFVREVMRTKSNVLTVVREVAKDTTLSGYVVESGQLIFSLSTSAHLNSGVQGFDAEEFDGMRWVGTGSLAATISTRHLVFGLGRFACPGRVLATAEIKLWIMALLRLATPALDGKYAVTNFLMTSSEPPEGTLLLHPIEESS